MEICGRRNSKDPGPDGKLTKAFKLAVKIRPEIIYLVIRRKRTRGGIFCVMNAAEANTAAQGR